MKIRLNLENDCYHLVQNFFLSHKVCVFQTIKCKQKHTIRIKSTIYDLGHSC
jgi:hypothetical protein